MYVFPLPGWRGNIDLHWGTFPGASDLMAPSGQQIVAIEAGTVQDAGWNTLGGNAVYIDGDDGLAYYYAHLRDLPLVHVGDHVAAGQALGSVGNTGDAAGGPTHLHIGIGHGIINGGGAQGGAGQNFDAVAFLRGLYSGQQPIGTNVVQTVTNTATATSANPLDALTGIASLFLGLFRWLASLVG